MPACHAGDRRFESGRVRQFPHFPLPLRSTRYQSVGQHSAGHLGGGRPYISRVRVLDSAHLGAWRVAAAKRSGVERFRRRTTAKRVADPPAERCANPAGDSQRSDAVRCSDVHAVQ